ncbi:MAG: DUF4440 domain-containing protein [Saprospiraceae bacterium]|nr:DUF4440 domain-containing protein [Saprospiraceae bacterium]
MKQILLKVLVLLATAQINWTCAAQNLDPENEKSAILQAEREMNMAAGFDDLEGLWSHWDKDAVMLLSLEKTVKGIEEIKEFTVGNRVDINFRITWKNQGVGVSPSGDMGYTYGVGSVTRSGPNGQPSTRTRPYLLIWKKDAKGRWKVLIDRP